MLLLFLFLLLGSFHNSLNNVKGYSHFIVNNYINIIVSLNSVNYEIHLSITLYKDHNYIYLSETKMVFVLVCVFSIDFSML